MNNSKQIKQVKNILDSVINDMSQHTELYAKNPEKDFTRNRKLDFATLTRFILSMQGGSLNREMYKYFQSDDIASVSAFVQQRDKLSPNAFKVLFDRFNAVCNDNKLLNNKYRLLAVDGSDLNIALNKESDSYIKPQATKNNGELRKGYNQLHLNALYDILNKVYVDAIIQPRPKMNERQALIDMITATTYNEPTIIVADRGYPSANLLTHFNKKDNLEYLIRAKNQNAIFTNGLPMKELDVDVTKILTTNRAYRFNDDCYFLKKFKHNALINKEYSEKNRFSQWDFGMFEKITVRVVRFEISPNTYETIFTSLPREEFSIADIKKIYGMRWGIETSFRELKYSIGLINFHAKREDFILQEIFAHLTMYNYCERIMALICVYQCKDRKHTYQINYTMAMMICMDYFNHKHKTERLETLITRYILPIREGRQDRRKMRAQIAVFFIYRVAA